MSEDAVPRVGLLVIGHRGLMCRRSWSRISGDRLLRVAYQLTHDRAAAQDLVQEALLRVYGSVCRPGRTPEDRYAYLRRAVINEHARTRWLRRSSTEAVTDMVPERSVAGVSGRPDRRSCAVVDAPGPTDPVAESDTASPRTNIRTA